MRTQSIMNDFHNEFQMMRKLDHKNIVKLRGLSIPSGRLVMEYIELGSLFSWLIQKNKQGVQYYEIFHQLLLFASQICEGMEYLHMRNVIHRDLAARNVMVARDPLNPSYLIAKISDFGLAKEIRNQSDYYRGNPEEFPVQWYAPECLKQCMFSYRSDVWSFGVTMWEIFSFGKKPEYKANGHNLNIIEIYEALQSGRRLEKVVPMTQKVYQIILECWAFEFKDRPDFGQIFHKISRLDPKNLFE